VNFSRTYHSLSPFLIEDFYVQWFDYFQYCSLTYFHIYSYTLIVMGKYLGRHGRVQRLRYGVHGRGFFMWPSRVGEAAGDELEHNFLIVHALFVAFF
jgi:hypothetical protein